MKILSVVGARPNFVKLAALLHEMGRRPGIVPVTVHTGQHHDPSLAAAFFEDLDLPPPDVDLGVAADSSLAQIGGMLTALEPVLGRERPDRVLVVGDVNSTLAGALVASRLGLRLAHVEAGLRSFDPTMPEEINRRLTDALAEDLFASEESAVANLRREGTDPARVHLVGNVMIDTLLRFRERAERSTILRSLGIEPGRYAVLTLHRPSNVDDPARLEALLDVIGEVSRRLPVIFPVHPRTRARLPRGIDPEDVRPITPLGYLDFLRLEASARLVLTDSGGIQEETTVLGVPCLTLRERTERPATVTHGTNRVVGTDAAAIRSACHEALDSPPPGPRHPPLWDGSAAARVLDILTRA